MNLIYVANKDVTGRDVCLVSLLKNCTTYLTSDHAMCAFAVRTKFVLVFDSVSE